MQNGIKSPPPETTQHSTVIGINFGGSYASIAVVNKEGLADTIANEDGERQIACAVSFHGDQVYIGNQAKSQLIKNSKNTITGFRDLLGKKFSDVTVQPISAPVIDHEGMPAYTVTILPTPTPAPTPSVRSPGVSATATPLVLEPAEPIPQPKTLTASETTTLFLRALYGSAQDFLSLTRIQGAVIVVPTWFSPEARSALVKSAEEAGINVLQILDAPAATAVAYASLPPSIGHAPSPDRMTLILDVGASSVDLTLLSVKQGLFHSLGSSHTPGIGGDAIDAKLVSYFAKDFTKKTKIPLSVGKEDLEPEDRRAQAKLLLAVEHTKRTLSASTGAASCSVESLKQGADFSGSINRLRFDVEVASIYNGVVDAIKALLSSSGKEALHVDEVILVGGSASLPGLVSKLELLFPDSTEIRTQIDPSEVLSRGAALQAQLIASLGPEDPLLESFKSPFKARATSKTISLLFPNSESPADWVSAIPAETPLPCRRTVTLEPVAGSKRVGFEVWEIKESIKVEVTKAPPSEDDDEEEEEEVETREKLIEKDTYLTGVGLDLKGTAGVQVIVELTLDGERTMSVQAWEVGFEKNAVKVTVISK